MRRILAVAVLMALLLAAGWVSLRAPKARPRCLATLQVLGITNDPAGTRQATLLLSNAGTHAIYLMPLFGLENRSGRWRTNLIPPKAIALSTNLMGVLPFHPRTKRLKIGDFYTVNLPLPFDDSGWRASFWYIEDRPALTILWDNLTRAVSRQSKQDRQQIAFTEWIERESSADLAHALDGGIGFLLPSEYHWRRAGECEPQSLVPCSAANAIRTKQQSTLLSW
jgi:hypothetical protein